MKQISYYLIILCVMLLVSCKKDNNSGTTNPVTPPVTSVTKISPDGFNYYTTKSINLNISLKAADNSAIAGVVVSISLPDSAISKAPIFRAVTDKNGNISATVPIPAQYTQLIIDPAYVGLLRNALANINGNTVNAVIGGSTGFSGDIVAQTVSPSSSSKTGLSIGRSINAATYTDFGYDPPYTSSSNAVAAPQVNGVPLYLDPTNDVVPASLLSNINASFPEFSPLPNTHPQYVNSSAVNVVNVTATTDLYATFISEGTIYYNTLLWYSYPTNNPPTTELGGTNNGGIDKLHVLFPNASALGSGGGLVTGNRVKIGTFSPGTTVAFCLFQNAWTTFSNPTGYGISQVDPSVRFHSQDALNPETPASLKRHEVMVYDNINNLFVCGFEDQNRQVGSDNDFNDVVFYVKSSVSEAISTNGVQAIDRGGDSDGDGVPDTQDAFPNDPTRAYVNYFPSQTGFAQLAFEDNWPAKGDYDMNDLVLNYRYTFSLNAQNQVVDMTGEYNCAAVGASFRNGFGVQLPVSASAVASVTGQKLIGNTISLASNGVEAGQTYAVVVPFDNTDAMIKNQDGSFFVNTIMSKDKVTNGSTATVKILFNSPIAAGIINNTTLNPFLISNQRRGYEIHLPGYNGTDKATTNLFNTADDNSNITKYTSKDNWPWAINYTGAFNYPIEGTNVSQAYPHFLDWAGAAGLSFTDWYTNTTAGYRNTAYIYSK